MYKDGLSFEMTAMAGVACVNSESISCNSSSTGCSNAASDPSEIWDVEHRRYLIAQYIGEICWIFSEVTWILLIPVACIPSGFLALICLSYLAQKDFSNSHSGQLDLWIPSFMQMIWLLVNCVWMTSEVLWDAPDQQTPWAQTSILAENDDLYAAIEVYCITGFFLPPAIWFLATSYLAMFKRNLQQARLLFFFGGPVAMWALMDAVWALGWVWASVVACVLTVCFIFCCSNEETRMGCRGIDRSDILWIVWTGSNQLWILTELVFDDSLPWRYAAAALGVIALLMLFGSYEQVKARLEQRWSDIPSHVEPNAI